jgi:hypothetical protein
MAQMMAKIRQDEASPFGKHDTDAFHGPKDTKKQVRRGRRIEKRQWRKEAGL